MRRAGIPWLGLVLVFAASMVAGWFLARERRPQRRAAGHHHAVARFVQAVTPAPARSPTVEPSAVASPPATPTATPHASVPSAAAAAGAARLAIIIDDCGQWPSIERSLIALPIALTVSIMPDAPYVKDIQTAAADAGQGIMLHLPMEPRSGKSAGGGEVTTAMDDAAIAAQVRLDLANVPLARGVNNHEGSKATADARVMRDVAQVLASEGRFFVDSRTTVATVAAKETAELAVPTSSRNVFLDDDLSVPAVEVQLERAADVARQKGSAIAIGHPKQAVLDALRAEIPLLEKKGITFVLAQDLVQ